MTLSAFLRGTVPRPNPTPPGRYSLLHRHAEGGPWTVVASADTREGLVEESRAGWRGWTTVSPDPGDLARLVTPNGKGVMVALASDGTLARLPLPFERWRSPNSATGKFVEGLYWPEAWESCPFGSWMAYALRDGLVPAPLLRAAGVAMARLVEGYRTDLPRFVDAFQDLAFDPGAEVAPGSPRAMRLTRHREVLRDELDANRYREGPIARTLVAVIDLVLGDAEPGKAVSKILRDAAYAASDFPTLPRTQATPEEARQASETEEVMLERKGADRLRELIPLREVVLGLLASSGAGGLR